MRAKGNPSLHFHFPRITPPPAPPVGQATACQRHPLRLSHNPLSRLRLYCQSRKRQRRPCLPEATPSNLAIVDLPPRSKSHLRVALASPPNNRPAILTKQISGLASVPECLHNKLLPLTH